MITFNFRALLATGLVALVAVFPLLLTGCNSTPVKSPVEPQSLGHFELGQQFYQDFFDTGSIESANNAVRQFSLALADSPEKVAVQKMHYLSLYLRAAVLNSANMAEVVAAYKKLHPVLQLEVPPPSRALYSKSVKNKLSTAEENEALIQQMILEAPGNAYSWSTLSTHHQENKNYWLALAAAKQAYKLAPQDVELMYRLGESYNNILETYSCRPQETELTKLAATYMAKAAAKQPSQLYLGNTALQYIRLGLAPLAYNQAKKAWNLEKNYWTASYFGTSALYMQRYDESLQAANYLISTEHKGYGIEMRTEALFAKGEYQSALKSVQQLKRYWAQNPSDASPQIRVIYNWVESVLSNKKKPFPVSRTKLYSEWTDSILDRIDPNIETATSLDTLANDRCHLSEAHFYEAYRSWMNGDNNAAKKQLELTLKQNILLYSENVWAKLLLEGTSIN